MPRASKTIVSSVAIIALACGILAAIAAERSSKLPESGDRNGLVVHEWGTFTSFAGSDGVAVPFGTEVGQDLPGFVLTRATQQQRFNGGKFPDGPWIFSKGDLVALQRMETPVIYFYTDKPREVSARVDFPQGLLTEFYPPVRKMNPAFSGSMIEPVKSSSIDWGRIHLIPPDRSAAEPTFPPAEKSHYLHARDTDSAIVQFSDHPGETLQEKFLFYRGLGNFSIPVTVKSREGGHFVLSEPSDRPVGAAFLIRIAPDKVWFSRYTPAAGEQALEMSLPRQQGSLDELAESVTRALIDEGLFEKEARAMVQTWRSSWFAEEGSRLLYTVPREITDRLLPLSIEPSPEKMVRVFVGRLELLTADREMQIRELFSRVGASGRITPEEARELRGLGRFLLPALDRVARVIGDPNDEQIRQKRDALWHAVYAAQQ